MEKAYRYELTYEGEPQGIGFLVGLRDVGIDSNVLDTLIQEFDEKLIIPDLDAIAHDKRKGYLASYFTEKGKNVFYPTIKTIIDYVDSLETEWEVNEEIIEAYQPLYQDDFQIVVFKKH